MTELEQLIRSPSRGDETFPTVDDDALLLWAEEHGRSPAEAVKEALLSGIVPRRYAKNLTALTLEEQRLICDSTVLVCGCGGLGGIMVQLLARAGVGRLRLVDGDVFAESNLNRQLLSDRSVLAQSKVRVAKQAVGMINPFVFVEAVEETLDHTNADQLIQGTDLVLDALDNIEGRRLLGATARRLGVPFIHGAVAGWWGQVSTFLPDSGHDLSSIYGSMWSRDAAEQDLGVLGPTAAIIGGLQSLEALRLLCGRSPAYNGRLLYLDGENGRIGAVPLEDGCPV